MKKQWKHTTKEREGILGDWEIIRKIYEIKKKNLNFVEEFTVYGLDFEHDEWL